MSISPEEAGITHFAADIAQAGYSATKGLFRIPWNVPVNYESLKKIIEFNMQDKAEYTNFGGNNSVNLRNLIPIQPKPVIDFPR